MENKKNVVEMKLNKKFVGFVLDRIKKDLKSENLKNLEREYKEVVGLRFSNKERVGKRSLRELLRNDLESELKERKINYKEYENKVIELIDLD